MLIEIERARVQHRIDTYLKYHDGNVASAVVGSGIGISYLFAKDIVKALDYAAREISRLRGMCKQ